jgi:predicted choloylglycine hydrolase
MKRRKFLKSIVLSGFLSRKLLAAHSERRPGFTAGNVHRFDTLEVKGSYEQIGYRIGQVFSRNIKSLIERRANWHSNLLSILSSRDGRLQSEEYRRITEKHFPHLLAELRGMADGAGLHFNALWAICIKSELSALEDEPSGCSTIFHRDAQRMWLFHNEDGHKAYAGLMFMLKVKPPSGINYLSLVYPGTLTGNGPSLNNQGLIQTTNYIGSTRSLIGIPRYILGRAVLEAKNPKEAIDIVTMSPRSYPYHHNIGSIPEKSYFSLETTPASREMIQPSDIYCHTNHLLFDNTKNYEAEDQQYKQTSSMSRFGAIQNELQLLDQEDITAKNYLRILSSHENAPYSPCRHPDRSVKGITLGTNFIDFKTGIFRIYQGNPCHATINNYFTDYDYRTI